MGCRALLHHAEQAVSARRHGRFARAPRKLARLGVQALESSAMQPTTQPGRAQPAWIVRGALRYSAAGLSRVRNWGTGRCCRSCCLCCRSIHLWHLGASTNTKATVHAYNFFPEGLRISCMTLMPTCHINGSISTNRKQFTAYSTCAGLADCISHVEDIPYKTNTKVSEERRAKPLSNMLAE